MIRAVETSEQPFALPGGALHSRRDLSLSVAGSSAGPAIGTPSPLSAESAAQRPLQTTLAGFPAMALTPPGKLRGTVVFLHGAFGTHHCFAPLMGAMADAGFQSVAFSRRGREGLPPAGCRGVTIGDYLDDTRRALDAVPAPYFLAGHSLGGLLAQHMAAEGRGQGAILLASAPAGMLTPQARNLWPLAPNIPRVLAGKPFRPTDVTLTKLVLSQVPELARSKILSHLGPESGLVYRSMLLGTCRPKSVDTPCPMLVLGAEDDWIVSQKLARNTASRYGADLKIYAGMGHWLVEEPQWPAVASSMVTWLCAQTSGHAPVPPCWLADRDGG